MGRIEYVDETWNVSTGCTPVSPGCANCYARAMHRRLTAMGQPKYHHDFEQVVFHHEELNRPLHWRKPIRIFPDSMSDLFHPALTDEQIAAVFARMQACQQHTFVLVTKRTERLHLLASDAFWELVDSLGEQLAEAKGWCHAHEGSDRPLKNVQVLATCENQEMLERRIDDLLRCPSVVHGLSMEPLLGPIRLKLEWLAPFKDVDPALRRTPRIDWIAIGPETGPKRRDCDMQWMVDILDQCREAGVPAYVKALVVDDGRGHQRISKDPTECGGWPEWAVRMYPGQKWP
jgi:protein gp37